MVDKTLLAALQDQQFNRTMNLLDGLVYAETQEEMCFSGDSDEWDKLCSGWSYNKVEDMVHRFVDLNPGVLKDPHYVMIYLDTPLSKSLKKQTKTRLK